MIYKEVMPIYQLVRYQLLEVDLHSWILLYHFVIQCKIFPSKYLSPNDSMAVELYKKLNFTERGGKF